MLYTPRRQYLLESAKRRNKVNRINVRFVLQRDGDEWAWSTKIRTLAADVLAVDEEGGARNLEGSNYRGGAEKLWDCQRREGRRRRPAVEDVYELRMDNSAEVKDTCIDISIVCQ
jgi:hypothetical protein